MHLNFGHGKNGGGVATFNVHDDKGNLTPIGYQYDMRKGQEHMNGFSLPDVPALMNWEELRNMWSIWLGRQSEEPDLTILDD